MFLSVLEGKIAHLFIVIKSLNNSSYKENFNIFTN